MLKLKISSIILVIIMLFTGCISEDNAFDKTAEENKDTIPTFETSLEDVATQLTLDAILSEGDTKDSVTKNLTLPTTFDDSIKVEWTSSSEYITSQGNVSRPLSTEQEKGTTLTARIYRTVDGEVIDETQKQFSLLISKLSDENEDAVELTSRDLDEKILGHNDTLARVYHNLQLTETGNNGATIEWEISNNELVTENGSIVRPEGNSETVDLTATIIKNDYSRTRTFQATIVKQSTNSTEEISFAKEALTRNLVKGNNPSLNEVFTDLNFVNDGIDGTTVTWESLDTDLIDDDGKVVANQEGTVTIKATISTNTETDANQALKRAGEGDEVKEFQVNLVPLNEEDEEGTAPQRPIVSIANGWLTITSLGAEEIYYTLDGSDPDDEDNENRILYTSPVKLNEETHVKAIGTNAAGSSAGYGKVFTWADLGLAEQIVEGETPAATSDIGIRLKDIVATSTIDIYLTGDLHATDRPTVDSFSFSSGTYENDVALASITYDHDGDADKIRFTLAQPVTSRDLIMLVYDKDAEANNLRDTDGKLVKSFESEIHNTQVGIKSDSTISHGDKDPKMVIETINRGNFVDDATTVEDEVNWTFTANNTDLTIVSITRDNDKQVTIQFSGTAESDILELTAKAAVLKNNVDTDVLPFPVTVSNSADLIEAAALGQARTVTLARNVNLANPLDIKGAAKTLDLSGYTLSNDGNAIDVTSGGSTVKDGIIRGGGAFTLKVGSASTVQEVEIRSSVAINDDVTLSDVVLKSGATIADSKTITIPAEKTLNLSGTLAGSTAAVTSIVTGAGTLVITGTTLQDFTLSVDNLDIQNGFNVDNIKIAGKEYSLGGYTLSLEGDLDIDGAGKLILDDASSKIDSDDTSNTITGTGTLEITEEATIEDSTIDVTALTLSSDFTLSGVTLGTSYSLGANTLTLAGDLNIANDIEFTLDDATSEISGANNKIIGGNATSKVIAAAGTATIGNTTLEVTTDVTENAIFNDVTLDGTKTTTITAAKTITVETGKTLTLADATITGADNSSVITGAGTFATSDANARVNTAKIDATTLTIGSDVTLSGVELDTDADLGGNTLTLAGNATVLTTRTLSVSSGSAIAGGANTIDGAGTVSITGDSTIGNVTIDTAEDLSIGSSFFTADTVTLSTATDADLGAYTLTLEGDLVLTGTTLTLSDADSKIVGGGNIVDGTGTVHINGADDSTFENVTINTDTFTIDQDFNANGLTLGDGTDTQSYSLNVKTVTLEGNLDVAANSTLTANASAVIAGDGNGVRTISGTGTLDVNGDANTILQDVTVSPGTLTLTTAFKADNVILDSDATLGGALTLEGNLTINSGKTLTTGAFGITGGGYTIDGDGTLAITGATTITNTRLESAVTVGNAFTLDNSTLATDVSLGANTLTIANGLEITVGKTLTLDNASSAITGGNQTISGAGTVNITGGTASIDSATISSNLTVGANAGFTSVVLPNGADIGAHTITVTTGLTLSGGTLTGTGAVTGADLTISGPATVSGGITLDSVAINANTTFDNVTISATNTATVGAATLTIGSGGLTLTNAADSILDLNAGTAKIAGTGTETIDGAGKITVTSGESITDVVLAPTGGVEIADAITLDGANVQADMTITADVTLDGAILTSGTHTTANKVTLADDLTFTAGSLEFTGAATAELDGDDNTISGGGSIDFNQASMSVADVTLDVTVTLTASATLNGVTLQDGTNISLGDGVTLTVGANGLELDDAALEIVLGHANADIAGTGTISGTGSITASTDGASVSGPTLDVDLDVSQNLTFTGGGWTTGATVTVSGNTLTFAGSVANGSDIALTGGDLADIDNLDNTLSIGATANGDATFTITQTGFSESFTAETVNLLDGLGASQAAQGAQEYQYDTTGLSFAAGDQIALSVATTGVVTVTVTDDAGTANSLDGTHTITIIHQNTASTQLETTVDVNISGTTAVTQ